MKPYYPHVLIISQYEEQPHNFPLSDATFLFGLNILYSKEKDWVWHKCNITISVSDTPVQFLTPLYHFFPLPIFTPDCMSVKTLVVQETHKKV